jgi:hypothetical protein
MLCARRLVLLLQRRQRRPGAGLVCFDNRMSVDGARDQNKRQQRPDTQQQD